MPEMSVLSRADQMHCQSVQGMYYEQKENTSVCDFQIGTELFNIIVHKNIALSCKLRAVSKSISEGVRERINFLKRFERMEVV